MNTKPTFIKLKNLKYTSIINLNDITAVEFLSPADDLSSNDFKFFVEVLGESIKKFFVKNDYNSRYVAANGKENKIYGYRVRYANQAIIVNEKEFNKLGEHINII